MTTFRGCESHDFWICHFNYKRSPSDWIPTDHSQLPPTTSCHHMSWLSTHESHDKVEWFFSSWYQLPKTCCITQKNWMWEHTQDLTRWGYVHGPFPRTIPDCPCRPRHEGSTHPVDQTYGDPHQSQSFTTEIVILVLWIFLFLPHRKNILTHFWHMERESVNFAKFHHFTTIILWLVLL